MFCIILKLLKKEVAMTSRTLSRKAAGNIKKDLKNSRAVLTVNESEIPANSITAFKERASKSAHSDNPTINEVDRRMLYYYYYHQTRQNLNTVPDSEIFDSLTNVDQKPQLELLTLSKEDGMKLYESLPEESVNTINKTILWYLKNWDGYTSEELPEKYGGKNTSPESDEYKDTEYLIKRDIPNITETFINNQRKSLNEKIRFYALNAKYDVLTDYIFNDKNATIINSKEKSYKTSPEVSKAYLSIGQALRAAEDDENNDEIIY